MGAAIKTALAYIKKEVWGNELIGIMDCDGQHLPEDMMKLFQSAWKHTEALVLGVRAVGREMPFRSRFGNQVTRAVYRIVSGVKVSDTQTGLRAFGVKLIDKLLLVKGERYEYEMNNLILAECLLFVLSWLIQKNAIFRKKSRLSVNALAGGKAEG